MVAYSVRPKSNAGWRSGSGSKFRDPAIHELLIKRYRLIYRCSEKSVEIVAFIHGARDLRRFRRTTRRP
jgi:plasmid stabilization system protein ParE